MANILINTACCSATCGTVTNPCTCPGQPVVQYTEKEACGIISPKSCFLDSFIPPNNGSPIIYYKRNTSVTNGNRTEVYSDSNQPGPWGVTLSYSNTRTISWSATRYDQITGGEQTLNDDCTVDQADCSTTLNCVGGEYSASDVASIVTQGNPDGPITYQDITYTVTASYGFFNPSVCEYSGTWSLTEIITVDGETTTYTDSGPISFTSTDYQNCNLSNCETEIVTTQTTTTNTTSGSFSQTTTGEPFSWGDGELTPSSDTNLSYNQTITNTLSDEVQCDPEGLPQDVADCNYQNYADWGAPSSIVPINGDDPSPPAFEPICIPVQDQTVINPTTCAFCLGEGKLTWTEQIQEGYQIEITLCFTNFNDPPCEAGTTYTLTSDITEITFNLPDFQQEEIQGNPVANVVVICITNAVYSQILGP